MDAALQKWLGLAPKPPQLDSTLRWHLFLSYRSVNRHWILQLYDILRQLGYSVFLDQYVLSAAAPLALSLSEELDRSASAIMVWSSDFADSAWCLTEFTTLESKENSGAGFRYVIAKLDNGSLPALAASKIYVDFADQREGPGGRGLLQLLYGLSGAPLPPEAVELAARIDDDTRNDRLTICAARASGDAAALIQISKSDSLAWISLPALGCETAEALIALEQYDAALQILEKQRTVFPLALRAQQLTGLTLARRGEWQQAQLVLGRLYAAGEIDPETLGIYAHTWMARYRQTQDRLFLLRSRDLYRQAFEASPREYYAGINAAAKSMLLGEQDTCAQLAARVEKIAGTAAVSNDYWRTATVAELQLLHGNFARAAELYECAVASAPLETGSHRTSWDDASLLLQAMGATAGQTAAICSALAPPPVAERASSARN